MQEARQANHGGTFLVSSSDCLEHFFQGYFFHGADYVFGQAGFEEFSKKRGVSRLNREDGCYVQMERRGDRCRFSADYCGYKKIFYFWQQNFWVVSNSLFQIVEQLRQNGYPVRPNIPQLAAAAAEGTFYPSGRGSFFGQLTTFDTIVQGVRCLPMDNALWIGPSGVQLERDEARQPPGDYRNHLTRFVSTWTARLQTLRRDLAIQIACDLTGGLDSRVTFALLLNGIGSRGDGKRLQIRSGTREQERRDEAVASNICSHFGMSLNGSLRKRPKRLGGAASYALWKDLCLGVYFPVYFPYAVMAPRMIHIAGGGGENHRPFYGQFLGAPSARTFVAARSRNIGRRAARPEYELALRQAVETSMGSASNHPDVMTAHYRHFRNRFHSGREPQYKVTLQPLASRLLDECTAAAGKARFRDAQMHYDLLHNLNPELLDLPFDKRSKRPSGAIRRSFTSIDVAATTPAGECFIESVPKRAGPPKGGPRAIDLLQQEFSLAKSGFAADFLGNRYLRRAERALEAGVRTGTVPGPLGSKRIAVVLAAAMFDS